MISQLQHAAQDAVGVMKRGQSQANQSVKQANEAGASLNNIASAVATITEMNSQIAIAAENQRQQTDVVNHNVHQISEIAQQVADGASKTDQSSTEVDQYANQLSSLIGQFKT